VGGLYGRALLLIVSPKTRMGAYRAKRPYLFAMLCGILISTMAIVLGPQAFGAGYEETKLALEESQDLSLSFWIVKLASTVTAFASGAPGGVFAPTLSIGAGFGHFFATLSSQETAPFMILAMVGVLSAVTHAPITAFVIVLEMVDNHGLVMPMIMTAAVSTQVSRRILPTSIYVLLAMNIRIHFPPKNPKPESHTEAPKSASET
jgi:H+/Cl- antiporter ClcA